MRVDRPPGPVGWRRGEAVERFVRSAGDRHLGADDIHRTVDADAVAVSSATCNSRAAAARHDLVGKDGRVVCTRHAAVQVDLGVARLDVRGDQHLGLGHCRTGGFALPTVGTEVVATEDDAFTRESGLIGDAEHQVAELRRTQTGVAAELVDLVRRRFDQHVAAVGGGLCDGRLHHGGMRRAHGVDADGLTGLVPADRVGQPVGRDGDCNMCRS